MAYIELQLLKKKYVNKYSVKLQAAVNTKKLL